MQDIVQRYINHMKEKHGVSAAMAAGSYVTGRMGPNSDIDLFFIWPREYEAMRGREYFEGLEFEYFMSPEWKFYDRMRSDPVSVRVYSQAKVIHDPEGRLQKIIDTAKEKAAERPPAPDDALRRDLKFWLETIRRDGEDLFDRESFDNLTYFIGANLPRMTELAGRLKGAPPVYGKYGVDETEAADPAYGALLRDLLRSAPSDRDRREAWVRLCSYLEGQLGEVDVAQYFSVQKL
ncbi:MAG: nucleotidyltransferase domain-containing protein [Bacillota bacterium]